MTESESGDVVVQPQPAKLTLEGHAPRVGIRSYYMASQHLWTARREAWLCRKREDQLLNDGDLDPRHRSHAVTAALSAVAFLEAFINAVWEDAADRKLGGRGPYIRGIPDDALAAMRELWKGNEPLAAMRELWKGNDKAERIPLVLIKFQAALVSASREPMKQDAEPFESADVLIKLRNTLVHFKPQWHWTDKDREFVRRLKSKITSERVNRQPIEGLWFPNKALGAGCADWACESSITFARTWHQSMGLTYDFDERYLTSLPPVEIDD